MKKLLIVSLVLLVSLCGILGFAACDRHVHEWGEWVSDGNGGHTRVCKSDATHVESGECKNHFVHTSTTATCTEKGVTTYTCAACGYSTREETDALDHDYTYTFDPETKQHVGVCSHDPTHVVTEACSFDEGVTVAPTCEEEGYTLKTCRVCLGSYRDSVVDALKHLWGNWESTDGTVHVRYCTRENCKQKQDAPCNLTLKENVAGSCTEDGYDLYECGDCHAEVRRNEKTAQGHSWSGWTFDQENKKHFQTCMNENCDARNEADCVFEVSRIEPTCETNGSTVYSCPICFGSYSTYDEATQKATGHDYPEQWTSSKNGSHYRDCKNAPGDITHRQTRDCEYDITEADCDHPGTTYACRDCEYTYTVDSGATAGHRYGCWLKVEGETYHHRLCEVCGNEDKEECTYTAETKDATCTAAGETKYVCNTCHDVDEARTIVLSKLDHDFPLEWTHIANTSGSASRHYRECVYGCGERQEAACIMKSITDVPTCTNPDGVHTLCEGCLYTEGEVEGVEHKWGKWTHTTETENGVVVHYHIRYCERETCGERKNGVPYSEKQPCAFDRVTVDPTCLTAGKTTYSCPTCAHRYEGDTVAALGHDYGNWVHDASGNTHTKTCRRENCDGNAQNPKTVTERCDYRQGATVQATCLADGYTPFVCNGCGDEDRRNVQPKLNHDYTGPWLQGENGTHYRVCSHDSNHRETMPCQYTEQVTDPTCDRAGYTTQTCNTCHRSQQVKQTTALGHNWVLAETQPISGDDHTHLMRCTRCSTTQQQSCSYNTRTVPATCTTPSLHIHTCTVCQHEYQHEEEAALGHNWGNYVFNSKDRTHSRACTRYGCGETEESSPCTGKLTATHEATCREFGYNEYQCSVCKGTYIGEQGSSFASHKWGLAWQASTSDYSHFRTCTLCGEKDVKACTMELESEVQATCTLTGYGFKRCRTCARYVREKYDKLGHNFGENINNWTSDGHGKHYRECSRCNLREEANCTMVDIGQAATCESAGKEGKVCTQCSYSVGVKNVDQLNHLMSAVTSANDGTHYQYCLRMCGYTVSSQCDLVGTESTKATCTLPAGVVKHCEKCSYSIKQITQEALGHLWVLDGDPTEETHSAHCERPECGEVAQGKHDFSESNLCKYCKYDGLTYADSEDGTSYIVQSAAKVSNAKLIVIPEFYKGKPVKRIRQIALQNNDAIETLQIPDSIEEIEMYSVCACANLKTVTFTSTSDGPKLKTIGRNAFSSCYKLASINLPSTVKLIDTEAFYRCRALHSIDLSESVKIENNAFTDTGMYNDASNWKDQNAFYLQNHLLRVLTSYSGTFSINAGTTTVGAGAFRDCKQLTGVSIPDSVKQFETDAFLGCDGLTTVTYSGDTAAWLSIVFENDYASPLHYAQELSISGAHGTVGITQGVTSIPAGTFRGTAIESVNLPSSVTSIGAHAFENCKNLKSIVIPASVVYIGEDAFKGCDLLLQDSKNWQDGAFYLGPHLILADNSKLPADGRLEIKTDTVTISPGAFKNCDKLKEITIPQSVAWIGEEAFVGSALESVDFLGTVAVFFASNVQGAGRWLDKKDINGATAAWYFKGIYSKSWKRVRGDQ